MPGSLMMMVIQITLVKEDEFTGGSLIASKCQKLCFLYLMHCMISNESSALH